MHVLALGACHVGCVVRGDAVSGHRIGKADDLSACCEARARAAPAATATYDQVLVAHARVTLIDGEYHAAAMAGRSATGDE